MNWNRAECLRWPPIQQCAICSERRSLPYSLSYDSVLPLLPAQRVGLARSQGLAAVSSGFLDKADLALISAIRAL